MTSTKSYMIWIIFCCDMVLKMSLSMSKRVNPKFCVNAKLWCKIEQKCFKAGAAQAAAAFSTKITALRGDVSKRQIKGRVDRCEKIVVERIEMFHHY